MSDPASKTFITAHVWQSLGWGVLPCQFDSKRLVAGYGPTRGSLEDGDSLRFWFQERRANLAVLAPESGVILDFDEIELYNQFAASAPFLAGSYTESTPRGGRHVFLKLAEPGGLALPDLVRGIELKRLCLVYPSQIKGQEYQIVVSREILPVSVKTLQEALGAFFVARRGESWPNPSAHGGGSPEGKQAVNNGFPGNRGVLAKVKAAWPILEYLQYFAPRLKLSGSGRWRSGRCPWHDDHEPSLWVDVERNLWGCHACRAHGDIVNWHARQLATDDQLLAARDLARYQVKVLV